MDDEEDTSVNLSDLEVVLMQEAPLSLPIQSELPMIACLNASSRAFTDACIKVASDTATNAAVNAVSSHSNHRSSGR